MQPEQRSRVDLVELKTQIVKKVGVERFKKYFHYLNMFLSQKISKSDFDKSCFRLLGRDNIPLHNQLIRSILKNACQAEAPPPAHETGPTKSAIPIVKSSLGKEDRHEQSGGSLLPNHNQNVSIWANGVLPMSPRKCRSGIRERKPRDRPSPLGPTGKVDCISHQSNVTEDGARKVVADNGEVPQCDYQRPVQHIQTVAEQPQNEAAWSIERPSEKPISRSKDQTAFVDDGEEVEQENHLSFSRSPLVAPLGIPFFSASVGGARKAVPLATSSYYDSGELSNTELLQRRMEQIAAAHGIGEVSMECANMLNKVLDVYLNRLIKSCGQLVGARLPHDARQHQLHKQQVQGRVINGMWPVNNLHVHSNIGPMEVMHEQKPCSSISLLDFKVAMELNPHQLGEDWPLLLEKICMHAFED